jgi:hypothetical protein
VVNQAVGGADAVHGDQQVQAVAGGELGDGLGKDGDVVRCGVGPRAAHAQQQYQ